MTTPGARGFPIADFPGISWGQAPPPSLPHRFALGEGPLVWTPGSSPDPSAGGGGWVGALVPKRSSPRYGKMPRSP
jgi:hypothetical protein